MWEARAEYTDGRYIERWFDEDPYKSDNEQQYDLECWLLDQGEPSWFSVTWVYGRD